MPTGDVAAGGRGQGRIAGTVGTTRGSFEAFRGAPTHTGGAASGGGGRATGRARDSAGWRGDRLTQRWARRRRAGGEPRRGERGWLPERGRTAQVEGVEEVVRVGVPEGQRGQVPLR